MPAAPVLMHSLSITRQFFLTVGQNNFGNKIPFLDRRQEIPTFSWQTNINQSAFQIKVNQIKDSNFSNLTNTILLFLSTPWQGGV